MSKKKVAILGGGVGAITTAFAITAEPGWADEFEVTVYQKGHRLGGKGASGRNRAAYDRIEEHGLHIWLGFYENAFRLMRACYEELGRPETAPLATVDAAFRAHSDISVKDFDPLRGTWSTWTYHFPVNALKPGLRYEARDERRLKAIAIVEWLLGQLTGARFDLAGVDDRPSGERAVLRDVLLSLGGGVLGHVRRALEPLRALAGLGARLGQGRVGLEELRSLARPLDLVRARVLDAIEARVAEDERARHAFVLCDLALSLARGILVDGVALHGFEAINDHDLREWLALHGARPVTLRSGIVRVWYDLVFGYEQGDTSRPRSEAGTAIVALARMMMTYRGAIFWEMQAGMGDVVFAPYFEVLRARGVRFEFFHEVTRLELSADESRVERVRMNVQARLRPGLAEYEPLVDVKGLPSWPSEPLYDQLDGGAALAARHADFESKWSGLSPAGERVLELGVDFDAVVLGISLGALPEVASELFAANEAWRTMAEKVKTVRTQAFQLWLRPEALALGFRDPKTVLTGFAQPFNTWADLTHLVARESFPPSLTPFHLAYFCGPMADDADEPDAGDTGYPSRVKQEVRGRAAAWLEANATSLWPNAGGRDGSFDYGLLVDADEREGRARLEAHYVRGNVDPSERYVQSPPGSSRHRLWPGASGFSNLALAGDWTRSGIDAGCVEGATISGLLAARATTGAAIEIWGSYPIDASAMDMRLSYGEPTAARDEPRESIVVPRGDVDPSDEEAAE